MGGLGPPRYVRTFKDPETGRVYRVQLAPMERAGALGVDRRLNALVFETPEGNWVGSVPVYHTLTLWTLSEAELVELFAKAAGRV